MTYSTGQTLWRGDLMANSTSPLRKSIACPNTLAGKANKKVRLPFTDLRFRHSSERFDLIDCIYGYSDSGVLSKR